MTPFLKVVLDLGIAQNPLTFAEAIGLAAVVACFAYFAFKIIYDYVK